MCGWDGEKDLNFHSKFLECRNLRIKNPRIFREQKRIPNRSSLWHFQNVLPMIYRFLWFVGKVWLINKRKNKTDVGMGTELVDLGSSEMIEMRKGQKFISGKPSGASEWKQLLIGLRLSGPATQVMTQKSACAALMEIRRHSGLFKNRWPWFSCWISLNINH